MSYSEAHIICAFQTSKPCSTVDWRAKHVCDDFDRRVQLQTWHFLWVAAFDRNFWVMKTSTKRMSVGKSGPTTAPVGSQSKHLTTRQLICAQMVAQKQLCSPFCCVLSRRFPKKCRLGKALQRCAWRHLNCTWKFHKSLEGVYPLGEQPNQARQSGSFNCHQSINWQRRLSKIRLIKIRFLNILMMALTKALKFVD